MIHTYLLTQYQTTSNTCPQFVVHEYALNGEYRSTFDYGAYSTNPVNKVSINREGIIYVPDETSPSYAYRMISWEGQEISKFGLVPDGATQQIDYTELRNAVKDRRTPSFFLGNAFIVPGDTDVSVVFSAIGEVHRYQGENLSWKTSIIPSAVIDSVAAPYYEFMEHILQFADALQVLRVLEHGVATNEFLFVSTNTSFGQEMKLLSFDSNGSLKNIYVFESEHGLNGNFDINAKKGIVYVGNANAEIVAYTLSDGYLGYNNAFRADG